MRTRAEVSVPAVAKLCRLLQVGPPVVHADDVGGRVRVRAGEWVSGD